MRVKELRNKKNISQEQLAREIGVERSTVAKWEAGGMPTAAKLPTLAAVLGVTVDELLRDETAQAG